MIHIWQIIFLFAICDATEETNRPHSPTINIKFNENSEAEYYGTEMQTWKGKTFHAFRGIPYAKSPTGKRRFKDPEVLTDPLKNKIDARFEGNDCPSIYAKNASEDCLFLNIYTKSYYEKLHPVIAFVHPGGLYIGSGLSSFVGPNYLMTEDIVLVTFNYRLGTLGYLNLGTEEIPGNAGFKDQVLTLRWIKSNIRHFGGDPENVTLMGYSAGALSVCLHLVSPMSSGLFHKTIIMSGSIPPLISLPNRDQRDLAARQAALMGCQPNSSGESFNSSSIIDCLNRFSGNEIAATLRKMFTFGKDNPIFPWLPVIEEDFGQERFLTEDFFAALRNGKFSKVPILYGFTDGELCTSANDIIVNKNLLKSFWEKFNVLAPVIFMYERANESEMSFITNALREHYLESSSANSTDFRLLCDLFSDSIIRSGLHSIGRIASSFKVKTFPYLFSYVGRFTNLELSTEIHRRAEHMDDLIYLFQMNQKIFTLDDSEGTLVEHMIDFFMQFVNDGYLHGFTGNSYANIFNAGVNIENGTNFAEAVFWEQLVYNVKNMK